MIHHIELGGKMRPVLFGTAVFRRMKEQNKASVNGLFESLNNGDISGLSDIVFHAIRVGEYAQKDTPDKFTEFDVAVWMDMEPGASSKLMRWFMDAVQSVNPEGEETEDDETPGEAKKKRKTSTGLQ